MAVGTWGLFRELIALARLPDIGMAVDTVAGLGLIAGVMLPGLLATGAVYESLMAGSTGAAVCRHFSNGDWSWIIFNCVIKILQMGAVPERTLWCCMAEDALGAMDIVDRVTTMTVSTGLVCR